MKLTACQDGRNADIYSFKGKRHNDKQKGFAIKNSKNPQHSFGIFMATQKNPVISKKFPAQALSILWLKINYE